MPRLLGGGPQWPACRCAAHPRPQTKGTPCTKYYALASPWTGKQETYNSRAHTLGARQAEPVMDLLVFHAQAAGTQTCTRSQILRTRSPPWRQPEIVATCRVLGGFRRTRHWESELSMGRGLTIGEFRAMSSSDSAYVPSRLSLSRLRDIAFLEAALMEPE